MNAHTGSNHLSDTKKKQWQIRRAVPQDAVGLKNCMELAYVSYQDRLKGRRLPPMDVNYLDEIRKFPTWVALSKDKIIGGIIMVFEKDSASIANIAVHPEFQGLGLGGELMKFAEKVALDKNYSELCLATHVLLTENISLYLHLGWIESSRDDVRVFMSKKITK